MKPHLAVSVALFALLALACNGGNVQESSTTSPTAAGTPTPTPRPDLSPTVGGIEAMRLYLEETGLDRRRGDLTDPIDCDEADAAEAEGDFCIVDDASVYAPGLVIVFVVHRNSGDAWEIHLNRNTDDPAWQVTQVETVPE